MPLYLDWIRATTANWYVESGGSNTLRTFVSYCVLGHSVLQTGSRRELCLQTLSVALPIANPCSDALLVAHSVG
jgi:hypothetical protein